MLHAQSLALVLAALSPLHGSGAWVALPPQLQLTVASPTPTVTAPSATPSAPANVRIPMQVLDERFSAVESDFRARRNAITKVGGHISIETEPVWLRAQYRSTMEELSNSGCVRASAWLLRHFHAPSDTTPEAVLRNKIDLYRHILDGHAGVDWLDSAEIDVLHSLLLDAPLLGAVTTREFGGALYDANPTRVERRIFALRAMARAILAPDESDAQRQADAVAVWRNAMRHEPEHGPLVEYGEREIWRLQHFAVGDAAPEFVAVDVDGNELRLEDFRAKVVVVAFFKLGSRADQAWVSRLRALAEANEDQPFVLLGVELGTNESAFRRLWEENGLRFPCVFEGGERGRVASAWRLNEVPRSFVLDGAGRLRFVDLDGAALESTVETLLQEPGVRSPGVKGRKQVRR